MISFIDGENRRIYLDDTTVDREIHPIDIYRELRTLRRTNEELQKFDMFMTYKGYEKKNPEGTKRTERIAVLLNGTKIVPFKDTSHNLTIIGTLISDDGLEGRYCFDRSLLSPGVLVDIDYVPPQVEVITIEIVSGSGLSLEEHNKLMALPNAEATADAVWNKEI